MPIFSDLWVRKKSIVEILSCDDDDDQNVEGDFDRSLFQGIKRRLRFTGLGQNLIWYKWWDHFDGMNHQETKNGDWRSICLISTVEWKGKYYTTINLLPRRHSRKTRRFHVSFSNTQGLNWRFGTRRTPKKYTKILIILFMYLLWLFRIKYMTCNRANHWESS